MALDRSGRSTAEGALALRAAATHERDRAVRNPDVYAGRFLGWRLRSLTLARLPVLWRLVVRRVEEALPGGYAFETARTLYMDEVVRSEVAAGARQLVLLGAGFDSRPYRMRDELSPVRIFEVDHPVTAEMKRERLVKVFRRVPAHVTYVSVDFGREDLGARLVEEGYDGGLRTLFLLSGVAPYLEEAAVRALLGWVGRQASGSAIAFDFMWSEALVSPGDFFGVPQLMRRVAAVGEELRSGIPRDEVASYLSSLGLTVESSLAPADAERYVTRADGSSLGPTYGGGGLVLARVP